MKVSSPPEVPSVSRTGLGMSSIGAHVGVSGDLRDAERQGRQDYALTPDPDGRTPWIHGQEQAFREGQAVLSEELHDRVALLDAQIASDSDLLRREGEGASALSPVPDQGYASSIEAYRARQSARAAKAAGEQRRAQVEAARDRLHANVQMRRHLHEQGREMLRQAAALANNRVAHYCLGRERGPWWRFWGAGTSAPTRPRPIAPDAPWFVDDLPVMRSTLGPAQDPRLEWTWEDFRDPERDGTLERDGAAQGAWLGGTQGGVSGRGTLA